MSIDKHSYGLDWIDQNELFNVTRHCFSRVISLAKEESLQAPPDPFTIVTQAVLFNQTAENMMDFEKLRARNKSISNAVGNWHQGVLGLADGWNNLGSNGGVLDLTVQETPSARPIVVEVKNRYNTMKASDEKNMWDKLDNAARLNGSKGYLVQIVPKTPERYDRPWKVSGRQERDTVRCCDGATAYTWAFNQENALKELYMAFPNILIDVLGRKDFDSTKMEMFYFLSMPKK